MTETALFGKLTSADGIVTVGIVGPNFSEREAGIITSMVQEALDAPEPTRAIVLDFDDVQFMNSSGIGGCVDMHSRAKHAGATTILYRLGDEIESIIKMTRLDKIFTIAGDEKKLEKALKKA